MKFCGQIRFSARVTNKKITPSRVVVSPVSSAPDGHNEDARRPPAKLSRVYAAPRRIRSDDKSLHRTERVSHRRERRPRFDRARSSHATSEMSLREGNEGFKTRIPRPAVVASPAPCAVEAPPARATAAAVKSAVAAAVRPISDPIPQPPSMSPHPVPETPPAARARDPTPYPTLTPRLSHPYPTSRAARARRMPPRTTPRRAPSASPWRPPSRPTRPRLPKSQTAAVTRRRRWTLTPSTRNSSP